MIIKPHSQEFTGSATARLDLLSATQSMKPQTVVACQLLQRCKYAIQTELTGDEGGFAGPSTPNEAFISPKSRTLHAPNVK